MHENNLLRDKKRIGYRTSSRFGGWGTNRVGLPEKSVHEIQLLSVKRWWYFTDLYIDWMLTIPALSYLALVRGQLIYIVLETLNMRQISCMQRLLERLVTCRFDILIRPICAVHYHPIER
jgi:hypothetical protein